MDRSLMYLSIVQVGMTYLSGFATAQYFTTRTEMWGVAAVVSTVFLLMSSKWEVYRRVEALLGPLPSTDSPKESKGSKDKPSAVGFALPSVK